MKWMRRYLDVIIASIEAPSWPLCATDHRGMDDHWRKRFTLNALQVVTHGKEKWVQGFLSWTCAKRSWAQDTVILLGDEGVFRDVHEVTNAMMGGLRPIWVRLAALWESCCPNLDCTVVVSFPSLTRSGKVRYGLHIVLLSSRW